MKKTLLFLIVGLILIPVANVGAYDGIWGMRLKLGLELPELLGVSVAIVQNNTLGAWYRGSWSRAANIEVDAGVHFDTNWTFGITTAREFSFYGFEYTLYPNLSKLNFFGNAGAFGYRAGRQPVHDPAKLIIDAPMDGVDFTVDLGRHVLTAGAGFTGLVFGRSAPFFMTSADSQRHSDTILAVPRVMEYFSWKMPSAALWFNPAVYFLAVQDLSSPSELSAYGSSRFHTLYLQLYTRGYLGASFLYDLALVGQYGDYGGIPVLTGMGRVGFSWLPGPRSRLGIEVISAGGDDWNRGGYLLGSPTASALSQYLPVSTVSNRGYVVQFKVGNITSLAAFFTMRPSKVFSWEVRATTFLRNVIGPTSSGLIPGPASGHFIGQEAMFGFFWRPKSDFAWDIKLGALYPGEAIVLNTFIKPYFPVLYRAGFNWSFSF